MNNSLPGLLGLFVFCILTPLMSVGLFAIYRWCVHRLPLHGSGFVSAIWMANGQICLKAIDGSIVIRPRTLYNWFVIVVLGGAAFFLVILFGSIVIRSVDARLIVTCILGALVTGLALFNPLFIAVRSLRQPSICINANSRTLEIRRGSIGQQILFSRFAYISATPQTTNTGRSPDFLSGLGVGEVAWERESGIRIQVTLDDGEVIKLGGVSDQSRATAITELLAEVTGVQVR
jgi:hypothetical protein